MEAWRLEASVGNAAAPGQSTAPAGRNFGNWTKLRHGTRWRFPPIRHILSARHHRGATGTQDPGGRPMARIFDLVKHQQQVHHVLENQTVFDAASEMVGWNVGAVAVLRNDELVGIFSECDIMKRVVV